MNSFTSNLAAHEAQLEKKLKQPAESSRGRGRGGRGGRGGGRGRPVEKEEPSTKRGRGRGQNRGRGLKTPNTKAKAQPEAKAGNKNDTVARKKRSKKRSLPESEMLPPLKPHSDEPPATPAKAPAPGNEASPPPPLSDGRFVTSARRRAHAKRRRAAAEALAILRDAKIAGLEVPQGQFDRQSYTMRPTQAHTTAHSNIGIVLKSRTFYIAHSGGVPRDLVQFAHTDATGGCTIGCGSYPSLQIASLGPNMCLHFLVAVIMCHTQIGHATKVGTRPSNCWLDGYHSGFLHQAP